MTTCYNLPWNSLEHKQIHALKKNKQTLSLETTAECCQVWVRFVTDWCWYGKSWLEFWIYQIFLHPSKWPCMSPIFDSELQSIQRHLFCFLVSISPIPLVVGTSNYFTSNCGSNWWLPKSCEMFPMIASSIIVVSYIHWVNLPSRVVST